MFRKKDYEEVITFFRLELIKIELAKRFLATQKLNYRVKSKVENNKTPTRHASSKHYTKLLFSTANLIFTQQII